MAFQEVQLDPLISYGAVGGPSYVTTIIVVPSGAEQRIGRRSVGLLSYQIDLVNKSKDEMTSLVEFYRGVRGRLIAFRFKDWTDYKTVAEPIVNNGTAYLQLIKTYQVGSESEVRTIKKPVDGTVTMTRNGSPFVAYTLDTTTGIVTLNGGADGGATYAWSGEFDTPVRFDVDDMQVTVSDFDIRDWQTVKLVEVIL